MVVERLPGVDAGFLYMETPTLHMHTLKVAIVDASTVPGGYTFQRFQEELAVRLHLLPPFRRRVMKVPFQIHHPVWVEDRDFDQNMHVRRDVIPAPGGMRELEQLIGQIASTQLDRSRPLWEIHVCEGLADGRVAVVAKMHHAIADGNAANGLLANIMDLVPDAVTPLATEVWEGEPTPPRRDLLRDAAVAWVHQLTWLPALLLKTLRAVLAVVAHQRTSTVSTPRPMLDTPRTSFNRHLTARRSFTTSSLPLADFKQVRAAHGVTLNDVVLGVVAGAMNAWLELHGERPSGSLLAGVPVATDATSDVIRLTGNRVSNLFTSLHTDITDPVERLKAISVTTAEAKLVQRTLGLDMLENWIQFAPPAPFHAFMRAYSHLRAADLHAAPFNLVVSNVPGPPVPIHIAGARLDALFSVGPILEGIGLNITVWSYLERMSFSALACPDTLPDVDVLLAGLEASLAQLLARS
jgi:diacylglycerol O-acyltransferase